MNVQFGLTCITVDNRSRYELQQAFGEGIKQVNSGCLQNLNFNFTNEPLSDTFTLTIDEEGDSNFYEDSLVESITFLLKEGLNEPVIIHKTPHLVTKPPQAQQA